MKCPKCNSEHVFIENKPDGKAVCDDCGYHGDSKEFKKDE